MMMKKKMEREINSHLPQKREEEGLPKGKEGLKELKMKKRPKLMMKMESPQKRRRQEKRKAKPPKRNVSMTMKKKKPMKNLRRSQSLRSFLQNTKKVNIIQQLKLLKNSN